jgi:hypothetical protein
MAQQPHPTVLYIATVLADDGVAVWPWPTVTPSASMVAVSGETLRMVKTSSRNLSRLSALAQPGPARERDTSAHFMKAA